MKVFLLFFILPWSFSAYTSETLSTKDGGYIVYYNTECSSTSGKGCDMVLEKYSANKRLEWSKKYGGNSWDYIEDLIEAPDGYYLLGNTSSYGKGNLDVYLIRLNIKGKTIWEKTYGGFFNEYGRKLSWSSYVKGSLIIEGERQICLTENVSDKCVYKPFVFRVDADGQTDSYPWGKEF
ncbi:MAG: hypothetical protein ACON42_04660 [Flavobacteriaceae bacterium]